MRASDARETSPSVANVERLEITIQIANIARILISSPSLCAVR
jgi:hypothetical protein